MIPSIETERLRLRAHTLGDLDACITMWSHPLVTQYIGGTPSTPQQTWARILGYRGHWSLMGFGYWVIEERSSGAFVGELGFADFHRDIIAAMRDVPELGWALTPSMHGRGLATEAARAAIDWADRHLAAARTVCMIAPQNAASLRVAEKCGYRMFSDTTFSAQAIRFFERIRPAPEARV